MPNNEQKVVSYLLQQDQESLKPLLRQLSNIIWSTRNEPIIELCKRYTKLNNPEFFLIDYISNEYEHPDYIIDLIGEQSSLSTDLGKANIEKLIVLQDQSRVKNVLVGLKDKPVNEVVQEMRTLKGVAPLQPLGLADIKELRIADRELEKTAPSTGYPPLDRIIKGFVPGHVYTMTGATNIGKSTIACNFAYRVAKQGKKVLYFSLEPDTTIIEYLASIWARKRFDDVTEADLTPPVQIDVYTKEHVNTLEDMIQIVENSERYDLIIVDHFGYFISNSNNPNQTEKNAMKSMAGFARRNKVAVMLIVHPRKPVGSTKKQKDLSLHDISGAAAFSQDATDVLVVARNKDPEDPLQITYLDEGYIAVHKTKSGPNGTMRIHFIQGSALILDDDEFSNNKARGF